MLEPDVLAKWRKAGLASAKGLAHGAKMIQPGVRLEEVADAVEEHFRSWGAEPAFPSCISLNECAAHYSPVKGDTLAFKEGDVVKLDVGAHVDGYVADNAMTLEVSTNRHGKLIEAARAALTIGVSIMGPNVNLSTVGAAVEQTIGEYGFKPIANLTGHSIERWVLHAGMSVPSIANTPVKRPKVGTVLAIEPFATDGAGHVVNGPNGNIYHFSRLRPIRPPEPRRLMEHVAEKFPKLPFAQRWCDGVVPANRLNFSLQTLTKNVAIKNYPSLMEAGRGMVAQFEHTLVITDDGCEVLTLLKDD